MTEAANWPRVEATLDEHGGADVLVGGTLHQVKAENVAEARRQVVELIADHAAQLGRPLKTVTRDPEGQWSLIIREDGTVETDQTVETKPVTKSKPPEPQPAQMQPAESPVAHETMQSPDLTVLSDPEPDVPSEPPRRRIFLTEQNIEPVATSGWRGVLARRGLHVTPSEAERAERADVHAVSQHWPGPRTIVVANGKGGAGKTPATVLLSAVFARYGGAGVIAWDVNQTRGTLGWRTEQGPHEATVLDLLPQAQRLLGSSAQSADLAHFVHHQTADRYDVLRSQPLILAAEQRVTPQNVDLIWSVVGKYYRLILVDTGNDESDPVWLQVIEHADQLVVPTSTRADHAEAGALLLDALRRRDAHSRQLADGAVAVITQADPRASKTDIATITDGYTGLVRAVVTIPHDPAMVDGQLTWDSLHPATRRAWLRAAAAVAQGL